MCLEPRGENIYTCFFQINNALLLPFVCCPFLTLWGKVLTKIHIEDMFKTCMICQEPIHIQFLERGENKHVCMQKMQPFF